MDKYNLTGIKLQLYCDSHLIELDIIGPHQSSIQLVPNGISMQGHTHSHSGTATSSSSYTGTYSGSSSSGGGGYQATTGHADDRRGSGRRL